MSLLSGQELETLGSILSCPGPSLCYVPRCALERDEVSRKTNRNLGMTSAFKELYLQCVSHIVLTICRMGFMKLMSKRMKCSWQGLASEEIWITLVEIFCNFLVWMGQCDSSVLAILLALTPLLPQSRFEKQIKHL